jgi:hypothetical protein
MVHDEMVDAIREIVQAMPPIMGFSDGHFGR